MRRHSVMLAMPAHAAHQHAPAHGARVCARWVRDAQHARGGYRLGMRSRVLPFGCCHTVYGQEECYGSVQPLRRRNAQRQRGALRCFDAAHLHGRCKAVSSVAGTQAKTGACLAYYSTGHAGVQSVGATLAQCTWVPGATSRACLSPPWSLWDTPARLVEQLYGARRCPFVACACHVALAPCVPPACGCRGVSAPDGDYFTEADVLYTTHLASEHVFQISDAAIATYPGNFKVAVQSGDRLVRCELRVSGTARTSRRQPTLV